MDKELFATLGLDSEKDLMSLLEDLENKQYEFLERLETANDENRKTELNDLLSRIDDAISQIKDRLASVNSALILDADVPQSGLEENDQKAEELEKASKTQATARETKLADKVAALKERIEARLKKESNEPSAADKVQPEAEDPTNQKMSAELQQGLQCYKRKDFPTALQIFKQLAEKNIPAAQYMLACMYSRAEGTSIDHGRAEFWMKKSADNGDASAQFDYAIFLLSSRSGNPKEITKQAMEYLCCSADQGNRDAMEKFVDMVDKGDGGIKELKSARIYCDRLLPLVDDSYDKQRFEDLRKTFRERYVKLRVTRIGNLVTSYAAIVSAPFLLVAIILAFTGYHQRGLMQFEVVAQLPLWVRTILFDAWHELPPIMDPAYLDLVNLPVLMFFVAAGWMLRGVGHTYTRNTVATIVVKIASAMRYIALFVHVALCSYMENNVFACSLGWKYYLPIENVVAFVAMGISGYTIGWLLNWIVRKALSISLKVKL